MCRNNVDLGLRLAVEPLFQDGVDNTHHLAAHAACEEAVGDESNRFGSLEKRAHELLVHEHGLDGRRKVRLGEEPTGTQPQPQRLRVSRCHNVDARAR